MEKVNEIYNVVETYWGANNSTPQEIQEKFDVYLMNLKITLIRKSPFYSDLLNRLSRCILASPEMCVKNSMFTACTDGRHIIFCPAFVAHLSSGQFNFVVMHELYHILMNHAVRYKLEGVADEDFDLWNIASDGAINPLVDELKDLFHDMGLDLEMLQGDTGSIVFEDENGNARKESAEKFFRELKQQKNANNDSNELGNFAEQSDNTDDEADEGVEDNDETEMSASSIFNGNNSSESENSNDNNKNSEQDNGCNNSSQSENSNNQNGDSGDQGEDSSDESDNSSTNAESNNSNIGSEMSQILKRITGISNDIRDDMYQDFYDEMADPAENDLKNYNECCFKDVYNKNQSSAAGFAKRYFDELVRKVPVKWSVYLRRFLTSKQSDDVSFSTPNKFYLPHGMIKPGNCMSEGLDNISFYLDTSGSISQKEMEEFFNSAYSIAEQFNCTISIYLWNTKVYASYENILCDDCKKILGSIKPFFGGTTYRCCLDHMQQINPKAICYVVLTDGYIEQIRTKIPKFISSKTLIAISKEDFENGSSRSEYISNLKALGKVVVR